MAFFNFSRMNILTAISYNKIILLLGPIIIYIFLAEFIHTVKALINKQVNSYSIISKILKFIFRD